MFYIFPIVFLFIYFVIEKVLLWQAEETAILVYLAEKFQRHWQYIYKNYSSLFNSRHRIMLSDKYHKLVKKKQLKYYRKLADKLNIQSKIDDFLKSQKETNAPARKKLLKNNGNQDSDLSKF